MAYGAVALVRGTTLLACGGTTVCSQTLLDKIVDVVAYGAGAKPFEGPSGPASALTDTTALQRKAGGTQDTNDNVLDFVVSGPEPRNMDTVTPIAGGGPGLPTGAATPFGTLTDFIYSGGTGSDQTGVTPNVIDADRAGWIVGYVKDGNGAALQGVTVSIPTQSQYGQATTRSDGRFDMVVNGGATYTLRFTKSGYFDADRLVTVGWQRTAAVDDVLLVAPDSKSTLVSGGQPLNSAYQIASATKVLADSADTKDRTAVLMIPDRTTFKVGSTVLPSLTLRLTEYTAGANGIKRMPAPLSGSPAYTYAVEISATEAAGQSVDFTDTGSGSPKNVFFYVDDFIGFPIGSPVPTGYYDRAKMTWVPSASGKVINITVTSAGAITIDTNGDGPDTPAQLTAFGITPAEQTALVAQYKPASGTRIAPLWRVPMTHMTPYDCNYPVVPPPCDGGVCPGPPPGPPPPGPGPCTGGCCSSSAGSAAGDGIKGGSIIGCDSQFLGEKTTVAGTDFTLNYKSARVPGFAAKRQLKIDLTGPLVHPKASTIMVDVAIAGQVHHREFVPTPNLSWTFQWDGLDGAGRPIVGSAIATVLLRSYFLSAYLPVATFGDLPVPANGVVNSRAFYRFDRLVEAPLQGLMPAGSWSLGDWTLSSHHFLDVPGNRVELGSGTSMPAGIPVPAIKRVMGDGSSVAFAPDDTLATAPGFGLNFDSQSFGRVAVGPNGDIFVADPTHFKVRRIDRITNKIYTVVGTGNSSCPVGGVAPDFKNDTIDATQANIDEPVGIAVGSDGSLYIATRLEGTVRKATPLATGKYSISTFAGGSALCGATVASVVDGNAATTATFNRLGDVAVASDGSVYIADQNDNRVLRVDQAGKIYKVAGNGSNADSQANDGSLATQVPIRVKAIAAGTEGNVFISWDHSLVNVDRNGTLHYLTKAFDSSQAIVEGAPISTQCIDSGAGSSLATRPDGSVAFYTPGFYGVGGDNRYFIRVVDTKGIVTSIAATKDSVSAPANPGIAMKNGPPTARALAAAPNGDILVNTNNSIYRIATMPPVMPVTLCADATNTVKYLIPAGDTGFCFDAGGVHRKTIDLHTGQALYTFGYDNSTGVLSSILGPDGRTTSIAPIATGFEITGPGDATQKTTVTVVSGHATAISDSIGQLTPQPLPNGLLQGLIDGENNPFTFGYDIDGRLTTDQSALGTQKLVRSLIPGGRRVTHTTPLGRQTLFDTTVDAAGVMTHKVQLPDLSTEIKVSNPNSAARVTLPDSSTIDPNEIKTAPDGTKTYIQLGAATQVGNQIANDAIEKTTLPSGLTRTIKRAMSGPLAGPEVSTISYDDSGTPPVETTTRTYSASGQTVVIVSPEGRTTTTTLDGTGHVTQEQVGTVALGRLTPVVYDQTGQRLRSITQGARSTQFTYRTGAGQADAGYLWHIQDGVSTTELRHDIRGRLLSAESAWGTTIASKPSFTWFKNDVLKTVRTPELSVDHTFSYNAVKEIQQYLPPSLATVPSPATNYTYTADRDQFTEQRSDQLWGSKTITRTYIPSTGQLDTIVLPGTSLASLAGTIDYDYFTTSNTSGAAAGKISKITGPTATNNVQYLYDGALRTSTSWAGDVTGQVTWTYNNRFWPSKETLIAGSTFDRFLGYDKDGLIVCNSSVTCSPADPTALKIGHSMIHGRVNSIIQGAATETWTYSDTSADYSATPTSRAFGELREQTATVSGTTVADIVYDAVGGAISERRDALGRIRFKTETFRDATGLHANQTNKWEYIYDERGQLKSTKNNGFPVFDATYDKNGNFKTVSVSGGASMNCSVDAQDRMISCGGLALTYYDNGEVKTKTNAAGVWTYHYDALGRLRVVSTPGGTQIEYVLDGEGRRIAKKVAGVIQRKWLYHDSLSPIAELDGNGTLLARYVYGSRKNIPDLVIKGSTVYRLISDQLGSPRYAVNVANKDDVQYEAFYGPFGSPFAAGGLATSTLGWIPFGFAGGIYDPDTGLVHFGAREYDPEIGRWMSKDPIRFEGDQENLYTYAGNDPVNLIDPSGLDACSDAEDGALLSCAAAAAAAFGRSVPGAIAAGFACGFNLAKAHDRCKPPPPPPAPGCGGAPDFVPVPGTQ